VTEYSNVGHPTPSGQRHYVRTQQLLCAAAILLFAGFTWSRVLDWSHFSIMITGKVPHLLDDVEETIGIAGNELGPVGNPQIWVYGFAVVGMSGLYIAFHRFVDQLFPAVTNTIAGLLLTALMTIFIVDVDAVKCCEHPYEKPLAYENTYASAAWLPFALAAALLAVGIAQVVVRHRAVRKDALDLP
jgi:hypothetical protein